MFDILHLFPKWWIFGKHLGLKDISIQLLVNQRDLLLSWTQAKLLSVSEDVQYVKQAAEVVIMSVSYKYSVYANMLVVM